MTAHDSLPDDLAAAHAMILAERAARLAGRERQVSGARLEIERLKLLLAKARREQYGQSSERGAKLIDQLELQLAELEESAAEEEAAAEIAAPASSARQRAAGTRKPARRPLPEHLPRERIVYPAPCACPKCGGPVRKLGEDVTETLECVPRRWKVVEHVREKVSCRTARRSASRRRPRIRSPVAAPARTCWRWCWPRSTASTCRSPGRARSTPAKASRSTSRTWPTGSVPSAASLMPLVAGDPDATSSRPSGCTATTPPCRCWPRRRPRSAACGPMSGTTGRSAGPDPPAAAFFYSPDRGGEHPERHLAGFAGHPAGGRLCRVQPALRARSASRARSSRPPAGRMRAASCSSSPRSAKAPIAAEAVRRIDELFAIERDINGRRAEERLAARAGAVGAARGRARGLAARPARAGLAQVRDRQGDRLHPQALDGAHPVPRRRPDLHEQQRGRAGAARRRRRARATGPSPAPIAAASGLRRSTP